MMRVFKFGGASIKDAPSVENLVKIVQSYSGHIIVVVSAMGKTTNALEELIRLYFYKYDGVLLKYNAIKEYHDNIIKQLFPGGHSVWEKTSKLFDALEDILKNEPTSNYNFEYDQIVCFGELISTTIISEALKDQGINALWFDIRKILKTNKNFREARVLWDISLQQARRHLLFNNNIEVIVTQGFIASDQDGFTTTLGREGSDYSAAIIAYLKDIKNITIWKDVPGVLNADPRFFENTVRLDKISYVDAIELAYFGTSVIHPKTIQPLKKKGIELKIKSFLDPESSGTIIGNFFTDKGIPTFICKKNQLLIRIYPHDFSFIAEDNLQDIFGIFATHRVSMNIMQNSAVSFMVCINNDMSRTEGLLSDLRKKYEISIQKGLELITIRHYDEDIIRSITKDKHVILTQRGEYTVQFIVQDKFQK